MTLLITLQTLRKLFPTVPRLLALLLVSLTFGSLFSASPVLENERLKVRVSENGSLVFADKMRGVQWTSERPGWVTLLKGKNRGKLSLETGGVTVARTNDSLHVTFKGISGAELADETFEMGVRITLAAGYFDLEVTRLQTAYELESIEYPAHFLTVKSGHEKGYVVVPNLQGILIPSRYDAGFMRFGQNIWQAIADIDVVWKFESGMLNMPWFGATRETSSILAHVLTPADCQLHLVGNAVVDDAGLVVGARRVPDRGTRLSSLTPVWLASRKELNYPRRMRVEPVTNGYVGMARRYREYAQATGRLVTLKEKIRQNPEHAKILGAPDIKIYIYTNRLNKPNYRAWSEPVLDGYSRVHTTFDQVAQIIRDLKESGVEKCLILLGGWNRAGYDREHVDMWPPAEPAGGIDGLRRACLAAKEQGYLIALHDNYHDIYLDSASYDEKHTLKESDGSIYNGGIWDGGPCHRICPAVQRSFLDRNLDLVQASLPLNAYYLDVITSTPSNECYDVRHPLTRQADLDYRLKLLNALRGRGLVVGSERGADWAVPTAAFFEGLHGGGTGYHHGLSYREGLDVPLFHLVYHDCVVAYWQHGMPFGREDHANHVLHDLLTAQPSSWSLVYDQWSDLKPLIKQTSELLGKLHEQTAFEPMIDHEILADDYTVQRSKYGNGVEVLVNYGITSYREGGVTIPPKGFRVRVPGQPERLGTVGRTIVYLRPEQEKGIEAGN